ncbi:MAG: hypothetical protein V1492_03975 [Candidatus Micrarchaeota archaeon]
MATCSECHIYKGLFSPLKQNTEGIWVCSITPAHKFTKDKDGYLHIVK